MAASFVEHRPLSTNQYEEVSHYVVIVNGTQVGGSFQTQYAAKTYACTMGYHPVHVARVRHLQNHDIPDHWRKDPC